MELTRKQEIGLNETLTRHQNNEKFVVISGYTSLDLTFLDKLSKMI